MKKGFTLIELLAVIVILAIISLIAVPIILNIISDAKRTVKLRSAEFYVSSLNIAIARKNLTTTIPDSDCEIQNDGNLLCGDLTFNVDVNGDKAKSGLVKIRNGKIVSIERLTFGDDVYGYNKNGELAFLYKEGEAYTVTFNTDGGTNITSVIVNAGDKLTKPKNPQKHLHKFKEWTLNNQPYNFDSIVTHNITLTATWEDTELYTLKTGPTFGPAIKTLSKGSTVTSKTATDSIIEKIEFYSNGELPDGYTLQTLQTLPNAVVSSTGDTIKAYYDSSTKSIFVYSEGEIVWNNDTSYMFYGLKKLKKFDIPYNVTNIGNYAFSTCTVMSSITLPKSVTSIGTQAFVSCSGLTSIRIDSDNPKYDDRSSNAIIETETNKLVYGFKTTTIPNTVTSIGDYAFYGNGLTSVTIPESVTSIGDKAFNGCTGITNITVNLDNPTYEDRNSKAIIETETNKLVVGCKNTTIPNTVTSIGNNAFYANGLTKITIPNSVTSIGSAAFYSCTGLTTIAIPESVTSIGDQAFAGCTGITTITVNSNNPTYEDRSSNAVIEKDTNKLVVGCKTTIIPDTVTTIGKNAFRNNSKLTTIAIPEGVTKIEDYAFYSCSGATSITLPSTLTSIGSYAFRSCSKVPNITIPANVNYIGYQAFYSCSALANVTFENTENWKYYSSATSTSGTSLTLTSTTTAAKSLKTTYTSKYWKRTS